jgi:pilus assembly protein CpaC
MAIFMMVPLKASYRVLLPVLLSGVVSAQISPVGSGMPATPTASIPVAPAAPASYIETLPETNAALNGQTEVGSQSLHMLVGQSIFIKTPARLKRVYVGNPAVVDSFPSTPSQVVITAKTPGVSSLIVWDELGRSQTYKISSDLDVTSLRNEIREALPHDSIRVEAQQDRVSLSGTVGSDASFDSAAKLAGLYAKTVVNSVVIRPPHVRQISLKVQMIEIDRTKLEQFGINFLSGGKNTSAVQTGQFPSVGIGTSTSTTNTSSAPVVTISNPLNMLFYNSALNIGLTIQDLQNRQVAQILAEPTITTLSGQKASFLSGGEFPFPVVQGSSGGLTSITIQFRPYGVKLDFTPIANDDGTIQLKVAPEVSALDYTNAVTISGYTIPAISTRRAETQVELRDGQSFAISGLLDRRTTDIFSKMPGIGDIPVLGQLFRSKNVNHSVVELLIVVTPTVVDPLTGATTPTMLDFPVPMLDREQFDKKSGKDGLGPPLQSGTGGKP